VHQHWLAAATEATRTVLAGDEGALRLIAGNVHALAHADFTTVVISVDAELLVAVAEGRDAAAIEDARCAASGTLSEHVLQTGRPVRVADAEDTAGSMAVAEVPGLGGTTLVWTVPIS
jgi:NADPH-dependent ferric siderophore reductase